MAALPVLGSPCCPAWACAPHSGRHPCPLPSSCLGCPPWWDGKSSCSSESSVCHQIALGVCLPSKAYLLSLNIAHKLWCMARKQTRSRNGNLPVWSNQFFSPLFSVALFTPMQIFYSGYGTAFILFLLWFGKDICLHFLYRYEKYVLYAKRTR